MARTDLLCHDLVNGNKWIDYADANGQFNGTDWTQNTSWCAAPTSRLYVGDFNADGRDDLLCHNYVGLWVDYADASGLEARDNWKRIGAFCDQNADRLYVGDVNGDGRDDLVCHDVRTGNKRFDYANGAGAFNGVDWEAPAPWCGETAAELH